MAKIEPGAGAVSIDVSALLADVGDASSSTLGSLYGILGNPSASVSTTVLDGIDARANNATLNALLGVTDAAGRSINGNIGDFQAQTQLQTLLAALGIPDVAAKPLYTCLITDRLDSATYGLSALNDDLDAIIVDTTSIETKVDTIDGYHDVPAANAATNAQMRDVIGNKGDTAVGAPDSVASIMAYLKALLGTGLVDGAKNIGFNRDLPYLTEFFSDETIDAAVWDETITNSGTIAFTMESGYKFVRLSTGATNVSTAVLNTDQRFEFRPNSFNLVSNVITRIVLEWDMRFTNVANILNTSFIAGFGNAKTSIRTSNNIAAICLNGDVLTAITDDAGTEALTDISAGITVTNWNKYRITAVPGNIVYFYINDTLVATHNAAASLPDDVMYIVFHNANDAAADADIDVAHIRQWYSE